MPKPVDHLKVAKNNLTIPHDITPEQYRIRVETAQAAATVALVEEQRTANLIALQAFYLAEGTGPSQSSLDEIRERLGLS